MLLVSEIVWFFQRFGVALFFMAIQAQLYGGCSPEWLDNGCGGGGSGVINPFSFNFQQEKLQQLQHQQQLMLQLQSQAQQQRNESLFLKNTNTIANNTSYELTRFMENQKQELDYYLRSQNEKLQFLLQEQRKQQIGLLMKKIESKASILLRQKDEEIARATNRTMELQNLLNNLEMENQAWQRVAQENEAMVESLNSTLEQLKERVSCALNNDAEDAESCCEETGKATGEEVEDRRKQSIVCKCCNSRNSCVLLLPCRHLCSCKDCAVSLNSCPVCGMEKKESIEAIFSWEDDVSEEIGSMYHQKKKRKLDEHCNGVGDELERQQYQFVL